MNDDGHDRAAHETHDTSPRGQEDWPQSAVPRAKDDDADARSKWFYSSLNVLARMAIVICIACLFWIRDVTSHALVFTYSLLMLPIYMLLNVALQICGYLDRHDFLIVTEKVIVRYHFIRGKRIKIDSDLISLVLLDDLIAMPQSTLLQPLMAGNREPAIPDHDDANDHRADQQQQKPRLRPLVDVVDVGDNAVYNDSFSPEFGDRLHSNGYFARQNSRNRRTWMRRFVRRRRVSRTRSLDLYDNPNTQWRELFGDHQAENELTRRSLSVRRKHWWSRKSRRASSSVSPSNQELAVPAQAAHK